MPSNVPCRRAHLLRGSQEEHWWDLAGRTPVLGIFGDADDLEGSGRFLVQVSEVFPIGSSSLKFYSQRSG